MQNIYFHEKGEPKKRIHFCIIIIMYHCSHLPTSEACLPPKIYNTPQHTQSGVNSSPKIKKKNIKILGKKDVDTLPHFNYLLCTPWHFLMSLCQVYTYHHTKKHRPRACLQLFSGMMMIPSLAPDKNDILSHFPT